jgi:hypothetical protein
MKKIKICDGASQGREVVLNFFITQYNKHLLRKMTEKSLQPTELMQGTGMTVQDYIAHLVRQRSMLNKEELIFIIDFLINLCKHCQIFDNLAVSLGTHLLPDLYDKTNRKVLQVVKQESAELLYINFDLRFKHFMRKFALYNRMLAQLHKLSVQQHWN